MRQMTREQLQQQLERTEQRLAALNTACDRTSGYALNPDNEIGGMRNRSARAKRKIVERWDRQAHDMAELHTTIATLKAKIAYLDSAPARDRNDMAFLLWWDGLCVGDTFSIGNGPLVIRRKNAHSVVTESGVTWRISEVVGLSRARIAALRQALATAQEQQAKEQQ